MHRWFPLALAAAAVIFMLPALPTGLLGDDLIQRPKQFTPAELPPRLMETGFVPADSGQLGVVLRGLFGYFPNEDSAGRAKQYGIAPWWINQDWKAALFRPVTAFTHGWIQFQFDSPLESERNVWIFFDWQRLTHSPFHLPGIGETVRIPGASRR